LVQYVLELWQKGTSPTPVALDRAEDVVQGPRADLRQVRRSRVGEPIVITLAVIVAVIQASRLSVRVSCVIRWLSDPHVEDASEPVVRSHARDVVVEGRGKVGALVDGDAVVDASAAEVGVRADVDVRVRIRRRLEDIGLCEHGLCQCKVDRNEGKWRSHLHVSGSSADESGEAGGEDDERGSEHHT
jgi:hypothetical protein